MTKDPRDPYRWTNREIQADSEGYVQAQQAHQDDREAAIRQQQEADDEARWIENFVRNGGTQSAAKAAYAAHRNQQAAEAAGRREQDALEGARRRVRQKL